jgi:hypothetical protein
MATGDPWQLNQHAHRVPSRSQMGGRQSEASPPQRRPPEAKDVLHPELSLVEIGSMHGVAVVCVRATSHHSRYHCHGPPPSQLRCRSRETFARDEQGRTPPTTAGPLRPVPRRRLPTACPAMGGHARLKAA